eukprot:242258-Hanusia_phi.AAC.1
MGTGGATEGEAPSSPTNVEIPLLLYSSEPVEGIARVIEAIEVCVLKEDQKHVLVLVLTILKEACFAARHVMADEKKAHLQALLH